MPHLVAALIASVVVAAPEYRKAEGTWQVVGMVMNGEEMPAAAFKDMTMVLKGTTVRALSGTDVIAEGRYRVTAVKGQRVEFDLTMASGPDEGTTFPAVNEWKDADTLHTCIVQPGDRRPATIKPEPGDRTAVFVIKRTKK